LIGRFFLLAYADYGRAALAGHAMRLSDVLHLFSGFSSQLQQNAWEV